ncbi:phospholipase D-like domain-containing protein [Niallia taxi]|nr:phospholipase D-like domain-containing protein [Niallia taxi]MDE5055223.1 phospholipase D-like domain-containing protein [Niallia taxi]
MLKEIPFQEGKVIFFKEANFWNSMLERSREETKSIYIATYNFNFRDKYEKSFYRELSNLANLGIDVRILYAKMSFAKEDTLEIEEIFKKFVLCAELPTNHSKIFITDNFAYIGSANFSFGSNNNYECGVIFNDLKVISEIRRLYGRELLEPSEFKNVPEILDPFDILPMTLNVVKQLNKVVKKEEFYNSKIRELIPEIRYLDSIKEILKEIGYPIPIQFNWFEFYMDIYEEKNIPDSTIFEFKNYLLKIAEYLTELISYVNEQYQSLGRFEFLKKIK